MDEDGVDDMGKGACQGDSGGPLICDVNGKYVLTGLLYDYFIIEMKLDKRNC